MSDNIQKKSNPHLDGVRSSLQERLPHLNASDTPFNKDNPHLEMNKTTHQKMAISLITCKKPNSIIRFNSKKY